MKARFQVSDKVVCVNARGFTKSHFSAVPQKGRVYVVGEVVEGEDLADGAPGEQGVHLVGIQGKEHPKGGVSCLAADRFRLLSEVQAEKAARARRKRQNDL